MSKLIRRTKKNFGAALLIALQILTLTLAGLLMPWGSGPQSRDGGTPADSQTSAADQQAAASDTDAQTVQARTAGDLTAADKAALRKSAHRAVKLYEPLASQVFTLANERIAYQAAQRGSQGPESPTEGATLTTDREDYPPFSYVYFHGSGFEPGETVNMIVVELDPVQQSFEPWDVVADENGEFDTSWYIFSEEFIGATFQATATGQTSGLTASATFTDANDGSGTMNVTPRSVFNATTGNSITFSFNDGAADTLKDAGSQVTLVVPSGWTTPQTTSSGSPGYVSATLTGGALTVGSPTVTGGGPWTITIPYTSGMGTAGGFNLTYAGGAPQVTAPGTTAVNTFTTTSNGGGGMGNDVAILSSPGIVVSPIIQQRGDATIASVTGTSLTVTKPSGVAEGDVMIANFAINNTTSSAVTGPTGWTEIATITQAGGMGSDVRAALLYKVAGASEPADYTFTWTTSNAAQGAIVAFSNVDTTGGVKADGTAGGPFDSTMPSTYISGNGMGGTGDPASVTAITNATANAAIVMFASSGTGGITTGQFTTATSPGALSELYGNIVNSSATNANAGGGWGIKTTAGSTTGVGSATRAGPNESGWAAILLALKPLASCGLTITCPADANPQCYSSVPAPNAALATTSGGCGPVNKTFVGDSESDPGSSCNNVITRTYKATDSQGNTTTCTQTITVNDTTPPTIGGEGADATIQCPLTPMFTAPTASDACDTNPTVTFVDSTTNGTCANNYSVTRTWTATDACGNSSTTSQTITVEDTTAPSIGGEGADATIQCPLTPMFTAPTASDACDTNPTVTFVDSTTNGTCANNYSVTRTWTATDACGNSSTTSQTITVEDTTAPSIGGEGADATIQCPLTPMFTAPTASDACDTNPTVTFVDSTTNGTCANNYSVTRTWTATDACGNSSTTSQTITVEDTTAPSIGGEGADATIQCPLTPMFTAPTASDACDTNPTVTFVDSTTNGTCANNYSVTRTWTATDACGNSSTTSQTITVEDTTAPSIGGEGADATIQCPLTPMFTAPTASDACDTNPTVTFVDSTTNGTCANNYSVTRTWTATDACGNSSTTSQTITVEDTTAPSIGGEGADATIQCPLTPMFTAPTASDACDTNPTVTFVDSTTNGTCANNYSVTRTWTATDACGNSSTTSQTITVEDTTAPSIGGEGADATIQCPLTPMFTAPTASDACDTNPTVTFVDSTTNGTCANNYSVTRTWTATDACGNSSTTSQTITVEDTTAPSIGGEGADATIQCPLTPMFTAPTASDACDTNPTVTFVDSTTNGTCANNYSVTRTWTATDACGNSSTTSQTITVEDTTAPSIGGEGADATIQCPLTPMFTAPTASDACDTNPTVTFVDSTTNGTCANNYSVTRTWTATDACGNSSTTSQTITVEDTTAPSIGGEGADATIQCPLTPMFTAPTASDACDTNPTVTFVDSTTNGTCANNYSVTRTWTATDACGNSSTTSQTITVEDTTAPSIGGEGADATIQCPLTPMFTAPTASDACDTNPTVTFVDSTTNGTCANNYSVTRTWTATDACGNSSTTSQTITVEDTTAPSIGGEGADATIQCPLTPMFTAPTASDACDTNPTVTFVDSTTNGTCANNYSVTRTWTATDACGNSSTTSQTITVEDTTAPSIGGEGADATIQCPLTPMFTAPTASDACDTNPTVTFVDSTTNGTCANNYSVTRTWTATDACGNSSTTSQTITVEDTTAPSIGGEGADATIQCPLTPMFTAPTASDACDTNPTVTFVDSTTNGTCANNYSVTRTWTATDACGNSSTTSQTITVEDTTAPSIGGEGADATIQCPLTPMFTAPTASDACDTNPTVTFADSTANGSCANNYSVTRTWTATDACGNSSTTSQTITVEDTVAPSIGGEGGDATIECPATPMFTAPTASDACDANPTVTFVDSTANGSCANNYTVTRTWTATDACNNSSTATQSITVEDHTAPTIGNAGANDTIQCPTTPSFTAPTASDACGGSTVVEDSDTTAAGTCANNYSRTKTWHAVDACGNTSASRSQTITVVDNTPPTIGGQGGNTTIECPATPSFTAPTASDACGGSTVVQDSDTTAAGTCANNYSRTRTWHTVDACGNTSGQVSQTVTVRDTTAPAIGSAGADSTIACNGTPVFTPPTASDACGTSTVQQVSDTTTTQGTNTLYTRCWRAVDACNNTSGTVCQTITRPLGPWNITGFYQPVDMNNAVNTVKGGSTVPLKFNVYDCNNVERTSVSDVVGQTCQVAEYGCSGGPEEPMGDLPNTGATVLRYDTTGHQFIQNWKTPNAKNKCYRVRMTTIDGSVIEALFKTK